MALSRNLSIPINIATGNTTTDGNEQTLASGTAPGRYCLEVDTANMVDGDTIELRLYGKANGSATQRECYFATFSNTQSSPLKVSPVVPLVQDYKATIKRIAGTDRAYQWGLVSL
jgi:hypothetical protein